MLMTVLNSSITSIPIREDCIACEQEVENLIVSRVATGHVKITSPLTIPLAEAGGGSRKGRIVRERLQSAFLLSGRDVVAYFSQLLLSMASTIIS